MLCAATAGAKSDEERSVEGERNGGMTPGGEDGARERERESEEDAPGGGGWG